MKNLKDDQLYYYIGTLFAVFSSLFIGSSFIFKKIGLKRSAYLSSKRAGQGGHAYLKDWIWWFGLITMGIGEAFNFAAYALAPASLVASLGALSVLITFVLACKFLHETSSYVCNIGSILCIIGATIIVLHSPKDPSISSIEEFKDKIKEVEFLVYLFLVLALLVYLIVYISPRYGQTNSVVYVLICSLIGTFTVTGCKGIGIALFETFSNSHNVMFHWLTFVSFSTLVLCIVAQMHFLNKALDIFDASVITPLYYVLFTSCVIISSTFTFSEFESLSFAKILTNICGFSVTIFGVFFVTYFKDLSKIPQDFTSLIKTCRLVKVSDSSRIL